MRHRILIIAFLLISIDTISSETPIEKYILQFQKIGIEDGLANLAFHSIMQDRMGFIWIGTENGLHRYDGHSFKIYRNNPDDSTSLVNNWIRDNIVEDFKGDLWIKTGRGICRFDRKTETFQRFPADHPLSNSNSIQPRQIIADTANSIWFIQQDDLRPYTPTLVRYNIKLDTCIKFDVPAEIDGFFKEAVTNIARIDEQSAVMQTYWGGLVRLDLTTQQFKPLEYVEEGMLRQSSKRDILISSPGYEKIFVWRRPRNLYHFNSQTLALVSVDVLESWKHHDKLSLLERYLKAGHYKEQFFFSQPGFSGSDLLFQSDDGSLWIGAKGAGLFTIHPTTLQVMQYKENPSNPNSLWGQNVYGALEDGDDGLWIATSAGVNYLDHEKEAFSYYSLDGFLSDKIPREYTVGTTRPKRGPWGNLLVYEGMETLLTFNEHAKTFETFGKSLDFSLPFEVYATPFRDSGGKIYFTCHRRRRDGLAVYDPTTNNLKHYVPGKDDFPDCTVFCFEEDSRGDIWMGTGEMGPIRHDPKDGSFEIFTNRLSDANVTDRIAAAISIFEDRNRNLWIGYWGSGIEVIPAESFESDSIYFVSYNSSNSGLAGDEVQEDGIVEDGKGNVWVATHQGISRFNSEAGKFRSFRFTDPFGPINMFGFNKGESGKFYISSPNGLFVFHPDSIKENKRIPKVYITGLSINNVAVPVQGTYADTLRYRSPLTQSALHTDAIDLGYNQNDITFEFAALNYTHPRDNLYKYKLEGYRDEWISTNAHYPIASYTNLSPGEYTFRVIGSNNDGIWNETGDSMKIRIRPPWWASLWAFLAYGALAIGALILLRNYERKKYILKEKARTLEEIDRLKTQFFTNVSHEFRTPLTLILGPLKSIKEGTFKGDSNTVFGMMIRNGQRLMRLINQLLDLSKLEAGSLKLEANEHDIVEFTRLAKASFESAAENKGITLVFIGPDLPVLIWFDRDKMERILFNLIGNAIKFTPNGGKIEVKLEEIEDSETAGKYKSGLVQISVRDSGQGIPKKDLSRIFDRFYQADNSTGRKSEGTGVGLALVKEFVELHHGEIAVQSDEGWGTVFRMLLPKGKEQLSSDELVKGIHSDKTEADFKESSTIEPDIEIGLADHSTSSDVVRDGKPLVLIVEDNADMRNYIRSSIEDRFNIVEAANGNEGLEKALERIPDLVISDVMMPEMDGYEMCKKLKEDLRTSHVPVILLTAKADKDSTLEGLELGADDYVQKPFDMDLLLARCNNLIEQRMKLRERFKERFLLKEEELQLGNKDQQFMNKLIEAVDKYLDDPELSVEKLGSEVGLTRTALYRKMMALTGQKPTEFIRTIRLKKAAEMIKRDTASISEIAYSVGFNNPSYFSETFKKEFGVSPKEYKSGK
jgi:signal transduction histidine kinase/DNA-binding response OmpR family regulator/ligand-binding sensor domain-containing protein